MITEKSVVEENLKMHKMNSWFGEEEEFLKSGLRRNRDVNVMNENNNMMR